MSINRSRKTKHKGRVRSRCFRKKKKKKDPRAGGYNQNRHQRDFSNQSPRNNVLMVNSVFKDPIYQILEKIKNEPYFKWPNKMRGDLSKQNQSLYCHYHQERGHTTEDCRTLRDYLGQLVKVGKLK